MLKLSDRYHTEQVARMWTSYVANGNGFALHALHTSTCSLLTVYQTLAADLDICDTRALSLGLRPLPIPEAALGIDIDDMAANIAIAYNIASNSNGAREYDHAQQLAMHAETMAAAVDALCRLRNDYSIYLQRD